MKNRGGLRQSIKGLAEVCVVRSGIARMFLERSKRRIVFLSYHNIVSDDDPLQGDSSLHLPVSRFRYHLDALEKSHQVVSAEDLLGGELDPDGRYAVVTFDDGYRGTLQLGIAELATRGLPCTVFVCPGLLGEEGFWWDRIASPEDGAIQDGERRFAMEELEGRQGRVLSHFFPEGEAISTLGPMYGAATEQELIATCRGNPLVALESHTWNHVHLPSVTLESARDELSRTQDWLEGIGEGKARLLSFPYGATSGPVENLVKELGLTGGFLVTGGPVSGSEMRQSPFLIPRLNVPRGLTGEGLVVRLAELWAR